MLFSVGMEFEDGPHQEVLRNMVVFARKTFFRYDIEYRFKEKDEARSYVSRYIPAERVLEVEATTELEAAPTLFYHSILITLLEKYEPSASVAVASQAYIMQLIGTNRDQAIERARKVMTTGTETIGVEEVIEMIEYLERELD